jgi:hypothetical protein
LEAVDYCIGDLKRSNGFDLFDNEAGIEVSNTDDVKKMVVRKRGRERIISPIESVWDNFFLTEQLFIKKLLWIFNYK